MRHPEGSQSLDLVYNHIGQIACQANLIEDYLCKLILDLVPLYLRRWKLSQLPRNFSDKATELNKLAELHGLLDQEMKNDISTIVDEARKLSELRNILIHAVAMPIVDIIYDRDIGDQTVDDIIVSYEFHKSDRVLDTSAENLQKILGAYISLFGSVIECRERVIERLSINGGYPEPDSE